MGHWLKVICRLNFSVAKRFKGYAFLTFKQEVEDRG